VFVGSGERDEYITQDMSVQLWELYTQKDPNIKIIKSESSPVTDVYNYVEKTPFEDGDTVYFIKGEKDKDDPRFKNIPKYASANVKLDYIEIPDIPDRKGFPASGTIMRSYIKKNKFQDFIVGLPKHLTAEEENEAWATVTGNTDYSSPKGGTQSSQFEENVFSKKWWSKQLTEELANKKYYIDNSNIQGQGAFAQEDYPIGTTIDKLHDILGQGQYNFYELGKMYNHSDTPNCKNVMKDNTRYLVTIQPIKQGEELTADYKLQPDLEQPENFIDLDEGFLEDTKEKILSKMKQLKNATKEQIEELKLFLPLAKKIIIDKCGGKCSSEEHKKLKESFKDVIKSLGLMITWPVLGITGNAVIGWFFKTITDDKFAGLLPSKLAAVVEEDLYNPNDPSLDFMRSSEWKAGMPSGPKDDIPRSGDRIHNRQTAPVSWEESVNESNGNNSELHIYDFDETIARVETPIPYTVESPEGKILEKGETTSIDFEKTKDFLKDTYDEGIKINWDFKAFAKLISKGTLNNEVFQKLLKSIQNPNAKVTILTARAVGLPVTKFLKDQGIWAYVVPLGLNKEKGQSVTGEDKANWIEKRIKKTTKKVIFIDDAPENRKAIYTLRDKYPNIEFDVENPLKINEIKYGAHDLITQYKDKIQSDYGHQQYRDLQLMISQQKDEEVSNWLKTKGYMSETKLFSKNWWLDIINEHILTEGGAAGHMAHPFNLSNVNDGKSLLDIFKKAADSLETTPGSIKIDGVNSSIRLIDLNGKKQFAMDRGSKMPLDIKGVTKNDLKDRFKKKDGSIHGMIAAGGEVLDMFNEALPSLEGDLRKLGAWEDPNILFNMEYVEGKTNVQDYGSNFIAIHGLNKVEMINEPSAKTGKMLTKRFSTELSYDKSALQSLLDNLAPIAKKRGFEVYGSVPTEMTNKPNFNSALSTNYTIKFNEEEKTQSLGAWLGELNNIPEEVFIFMSGKKVGAVSKAVYIALLQGENVDELFESEEDKQSAIEGFTTYLATEKLGDEVLKVLNSPMGSADEHEGVVIRDDSIASVPFKITGKFILGGMTSDF